ncbi:septal ring lytic transglycosylase RlpA family protein [Pontibacter vulgaris]|uniref:septal ring lytic transglycosylase RlpA family protein n=1 Tax=Pontibacter vulgaris TaxID=2905679 RepID=UPI001FA6C4A5|nr:septal ring lytic transglycosylase RlpA family protein [Pontibacter vulgaris]
MNICSLILVFLFSFYNAPATYTADGKASYYSDRMHGQRTSSGERYDKTKLTAAHATLPLNTKVRVTNLNNGKSVIVKINDRMSRRSHTLIDLSKAAAKELDIIRAGYGRVRLKEVKKEEAEQQDKPLAVSETAATSPK